MRVMVVGSGGREHAIAWKLAQSARVHELILAPGNAGMAALGRCIETDLSPKALLQIAKDEQVDLTVIGPEAPLVAGVSDAFEGAGLQVLGPSKAAARLEGSKRFSKDFMARHGIPTAAYASFTTLEPALQHLTGLSYPVVVKDSNLAAGKGVTIASTENEAEEASRAILEAGNGELVIEDFLEGQEISLLIFTDGYAAKPMLLAQDYKQALEGDEGPMTGGMGTVAPVALLNSDELADVMQRVVEPTLAGLRQEDSLYKGVLYVGLMKTAAGVKVLEYNCRFGDPETQVVLPLLATDLLEIFEAIVEERLAEVSLHWHSASAACVVMAAPGYPGAYPKGIVLNLPEQLADEVTIFHAGTKLDAEQLVSNGGRVLGVTALGNAIALALERAYATVAEIDFPGAHYRKDIGQRLSKD